MSGLDVVALALAAGANANALKLFPTERKTGSVASTELGADGIPVKELIVGISFVQEGEGDPSVDNPRPITGLTGANIVVSPTLNAEDGKTITVPWGGKAGSVYHGSINLTTGTLTVDYISETITKADSVGNSSGLYYWVVRSTAAVPTPKNNAAVYSDLFMPRQFAAGHTYSGTTKAILLIPEDQTLDTLDEANDWLSDHPTQIVFELDEPLVFQLSPERVASYLGDTNVWADTGDVDVTFRCDPALYAASQIST